MTLPGGPAAGPMSMTGERHITLISEDAHYARILEHYLKRRAYAVDVFVVGIHDSAGATTAALRQEGILVLDMGWYDGARQELYQALAWVGFVSRATMLLLVDESWPEAWVKRFGAQNVLRKPFPMETLGTRVRELAAPAKGGTDRTPGPDKKGEA